MVELIRNKWCDDLEDLLLCPICMICPSSHVYQCKQGHIICRECKPQLDFCPTCAQSWCNTRNRLAEHLITMLEEVKLSIIDPENEINKLLQPDTVSTASQTEATEDASAENKNAMHTYDTENYPCWINGCKFYGGFEALLKHLGVNHAPVFSERIANDSEFRRSWRVEFTEQMTFDRAFLIPDMGLVFLKLSSDVFGNLTGFILMAHNAIMAKRFVYQLQISCCSEHPSQDYNGDVCTSRISAAQLGGKCLKIPQRVVQKMLKHEKALCCSLRLMKKPFADHRKPSKASAQQTNDSKTGFRPRKKSLQRQRSSSHTRQYQPFFHEQPSVKFRSGEAAEATVEERGTPDESLTKNNNFNVYQNFL